MGDEERVCETFFAITQRAVVIKTHHRPTGPVQNGMTGCGVPLHRATNPWVEIRLAGSHKAKL